jgi:hypothetical protein
MILHLVLVSPFDGSYRLEQTVIHREPGDHWIYWITESSEVSGSEMWFGSNLGNVSPRCKWYHSPAGTIDLGSSYSRRRVAFCLPVKRLVYVTCRMAGLTLSMKDGHERGFKSMLNFAACPAILSADCSRENDAAYSWRNRHLEMVSNYNLD